MTKTVADIMSTSVVVLREEDNLGDVAADLSRYRFRHFPVLDGKVVVGLVTQRDFLTYAVSRLEAPPAARSKERDMEERTFVAKVMVRDPVCVLPETPIKVAASKLVRGGFNCLPVVNAKNELVGIVTSVDLLGVLAEE